MKFKINLFVIFICFAAFPLYSEYVEINSSESAELFEASSLNDREIHVNFSLDGYERQLVEVAGKEYLQISHPLGGDLLGFGLPELPVFSQLLAIPDQGSVSWEIISYEEELITVPAIFPRQNLQSESSREVPEFIINEEYYKSGQPYPADPVILDDPAILRDHRVVKFTLQPFQYLAAENSLKIIKELEIVFTIDGETGENPKLQDQKISRSFQKLYKAVLLNYEDLQTRTDEYQQPSYLFIYSDEDLLNCHPGVFDLQGIMDWKHQKGFVVNSASLAETGSTETSIKNYIQNAYNTWENPPEYVCLVGDPGTNFDLPAGYSSNSDFGYTLLEGNDYYPEVFIGRLSVDSETDMQVIGNKIFNYEMNPYTGDETWYENVLLIGDIRHGTGYSAIGTCYYVKERLAEENSSFSFTECYSDNGFDDDNDFTNAFANNLNAGTGFVHYRGWLGMSGIA